MKPVQATPMSINDIFSGHEFIIPDFQRPYSWDRDECDKLWDDLISFYESQDDSAGQTYFLGNIVVYPNLEIGGKVWDVIDGQQRLTTLMMLMRALLVKAGTTEFAFLENRIHKTDRNTDKIIREEVRLISKVLPESRSDYDDFKDIIIKGSSANLEDDNRFKSNYECLLEKLTEWWDASRPQTRENFIYFLRDRVMLLPIICESQDDALTLFETINDRGKPLDSADIFKAKIYKAVDQKEKLKFIQRWNDMDEHVWFFHIYMHILKAQEEVSTGKSTSKRSKLKDYIIDKRLGNQGTLKKNWKSIVGSLELCHHFYNMGGDWGKDKEFSAKETIYWTILGKHPNENWQYPLFVFIHKHAEFLNGNFVLPEDKRGPYLDLLESAVKFFFIKGVVYNSIEAVRNESHKVCVQIEKGNSHPSYASEITEADLGQFEKRLEDYSNYKRYRNGLVLLSSFLNPHQQADVYAKTIHSDIHIEHILPKKWRNYDQWDEVLHLRDVDKIGNLMPLEPIRNIGASNEFFAGKQDEYRSSRIQDALDLSKKEPAHWYPEDVKERHEKVVKRLMGFFRS